MRRNVPSPKPQGYFSHEPFELNPNVSILCPEAIGLSPASARLLITKINAENADRHLDYQSVGDQLDLVRLEVLRLKLLKSQRSKSILANEMPPRYATPIPTRSMGPNGQPGPTVPNSMQTSMRTRTSVLNESDISVLDIGPSLYSIHASARFSLRDSSAANSHNGIGLDRTTSPSFLLWPSSETLDHPVKHSFAEDDFDSDSVTLTAASSPAHNVFARDLPQRHQNRPDNTLASSQELQPHGVNRSFTTSGADILRNDSGFGHSPTAFVDEPNRQIFSLSVPQSPQSPTLPPVPILRRAQSSFGGINPAFLDLRNAEQARRNAGSRGANQN